MTNPAGAKKLAAKELSPSAAPTVSVVVPCYNYGRFLPTAVGSALSQHGVRVDVTIIDDASTDDSRDIAKALADRYTNVAVVQHKKNAGHVETYNEALSLATGEFVVKLDADDLLTEGSLARAAALMTTLPNVAFCYGRAIEFTDSPPRYIPSPPSDWTVWKGRVWTERILRRGHNVILQPEVLLRRTAVEETGGYRTALRWAEDFNWWLRLAAVGDVGRVRGVAQGMYRVHQGSLQRSVDDIEMADIRARVDAVTLYFEERGAAPERLRQIAFTSLIRDARRLAADAESRSNERREAAAEFRRIAEQLQQRSGVRARRGPSASTAFWGRAYRDLEWRLRWRRWHRWGV
jgi:glycosyltransferase involved in cell wall biosynthesis